MKTPFAAMTRISRTSRLFRHLLVATFGLLAAVTGAQGQGVGWSPTSVPVTTPSLFAIDNSGSRFVAVGASGAIITSTTTDTWTTRSSGTSETLDGVTWDSSNGQFVVVGAQGIVLTSPTGVNWTIQVPADPVAADLNEVISFDDLLVAVGEGGTILTSDDAVIWTPQVSPVTTRLRDLAIDEGVIYAVGDSGVILSSPDAVNWTQVGSPVISLLTGISAIGLSDPSAPSLVAVGESGVILTSVDGQTWTKQTSGTALPLIAVTSTGSRLIAVGAFGQVRTSDVETLTVNGTSTTTIGRTWTQQSSGTTGWMYDILTTAESALLAVVDTGSILVSLPDNMGEGTPVALSVNAPVVVGSTATPPVLGANSTFSVRVNVVNADPEPFDNSYQLRLLLTPSSGTAGTVVLAEQTYTDVLPASSTVEFAFTGLTIDGDLLAPGNYSLSAQISLTPPTDEVISGVSLRSLPVVVQGPDLSLANAVFPNGIIADLGGTFQNVSYDLRNTLAGVVPSGEPIQIQVFLSEDEFLSGNDFLVREYSYTGGISRGPSTVTLPPAGVSGDITVPDTILGGNYFMIFQVNGNDAIAESGSSANTLARAVSISYFDLGVTAPNLPNIPAPGNGLPKKLGTNTTVDVVTVTLQNSGLVAYEDEESAPFNVNLYLSSDNVADGGDALLATQSFDTLGAQSSRLVTFNNVEIPSLAIGDYSLIAEIEFSEGISDNSASGNSAVRSVQLVGPDLGLTDLLFANGTTVAIGAALDGVSYTLRNTELGTLPVGSPVSIEVFLSTDSVLDLADDTLLSSYIYSGGLDSGPDSVNLPIVPTSINLPSGLNGGNYFLLVSANRLGGVIETDTASNVIAGGITVTAVDLATTKPTLSATTAG
ncbi:MAG: hypothetical protein ACQKBV_11065, partial [Puniceicoccales bacterium]